MWPRRVSGGTDGDATVPRSRSPGGPDPLHSLSCEGQSPWEDSKVTIRQEQQQARQTEPKSSRSELPLNTTPQTLGLAQG